MHLFTKAARMKITRLLAIVTVLTGSRSLAQTHQGATDAKPASSNISGQRYPQIDSQLRATFRIKAPEAQQVQISVGATYNLTKGEDGFWTVTTRSVDVGFHYYWIAVDGVTVNDPASETFFGVSKMSSGIEVPSPGEDFYDVKNVPHGEVRARWVFLEKNRQCNAALFCLYAAGL